MQKFFNQLDENDRRIARRWRLASAGFYGSLLAGFILYAALHRDPEVSVASTQSVSHATASRASDR